MVRWMDGWMDHETVGCVWAPVRSIRRNTNTHTRPVRIQIPPPTACLLLKTHHVGLVEELEVVKADEGARPLRGPGLEVRRRPVRLGSCLPFTLWCRCVVCARVYMIWASAHVHTYEPRSVGAFWLGRSRACSRRSLCYQPSTTHTMYIHRKAMHREGDAVGVQLVVDGVDGLQIRAPAFHDIRAGRHGGALPVVHHHHPR